MTGYACSISTLVGPLASLATTESAVIVEAVVVDLGKQGEVRSGQVSVPFYPAPVPDTSETKLTNDEPSVTISVLGIPQVLAALEVSGV